MLGDPCRPQAQGDHVIDVLSDLFCLSKNLLVEAKAPKLLI
jgi:hypothetical protein